MYNIAVVITIVAALMRGYGFSVYKLSNITVTGPVTNVTVAPFSHYINIKWREPLDEYDNPSAYVVKYNDSSNRPCKSIIIHMTQAVPGKSSIKFDHICPTTIHHSWSQLSTLSLSNLTAYSSYSVTISPYKDNARPIATTVKIMTKEGESGPVNSLYSTNMIGFVRITYEAPAVPRGVIRGYRVSVWLMKSGMCGKGDGIIFHSGSTRENYYDVAMKTLSKCGRYRVEVSPINGWSEKHGVGETKSILIDRDSDDSLAISNVSLERRGDVISWYYPRRSDDCDNIGFMLEVRGVYSGRCKTGILSNDNCTSMDSALRGESDCDDRKSAPQTNNGSYWRLSGVYDRWYRTVDVTIWRITNKITSQTRLRIVGWDFGCFSDCHSDTGYSGIRSERGCVPWKGSLVGRQYSVGNNGNICIVRDKGRPFCATEGGHKYCDIPRCTDDRDYDWLDHCAWLSHRNISATTSSVMWDEPWRYSGPLIGYIAVLHDSEGHCEGTQVQMCATCASESSLHQSIKNYYVSCDASAITTTRIISRQSIFHHLHQNKRYNLHIIPVANISRALRVMRFTWTTLSSEPERPRNIKCITKDLTSLVCSWDKQTDFRWRGPPAKYSATLVDANNATISRSSTSHNGVQFDNLIMDSKYCLQLFATNDAGRSDIGAIECQNTLLSKPDVPKNIKCIDTNATSLICNWDEAKELPWKGRPESYLAILVNDKNETTYRYNVKGTTVQFDYLIVNVNYCLRLFALNKADQSEMGDIECRYKMRSVSSRRMDILWPLIIVASVVIVVIASIGLIILLIRRRRNYKHTAVVANIQMNVPHHRTKQPTNIDTSYGNPKDGTDDCGGTRMTYIPYFNNTTMMEYIATLTPSKDLWNEFGGIIWNKKINCIVMFKRTISEVSTRPQSGWAERSGGEQRGNSNSQIMVTFLSESRCDGRLERVWLLTHKFSKEKRELIELQIHSWPKRSMPELEYLDKVMIRFQDLERSTIFNPYLIHSRTEDGRTWTFMCIDRIIKKYRRDCLATDIDGTIASLLPSADLISPGQRQFIRDYVDYFLAKYESVAVTENL